MLAVAGRYTNGCYYALSCKSTYVRQKNKNKIKNFGKMKSLKNVKT